MYVRAGTCCLLVSQEGEVSLGVYVRPRMCSLVSQGGVKAGEVSTGVCVCGLGQGRYQPVCVRPGMCCSLVSQGGGGINRCVCV